MSFITSFKKTNKKTCNNKQHIKHVKYYDRFIHYQMYLKYVSIPRYYY